jgi:hypothetical protein
MLPSFTITPKIREIDFFSTFEDGTVVNENGNENTVQINKPFLFEIVTCTFNPSNYSEHNLIQAINTMSYIMVSSTEAVEELVWSSGKGSGEILFYKLFEDINGLFSVQKTLPSPLRDELLTRYPKTYTSIQLGKRFENEQLKCADIAAIGHLRLLKYANENPDNLSKCDGETCIKAIENGYVECLQYAHSCIHLCDEDTCMAAAIRIGQLDCLIFLHTNIGQYSIKNSLSLTVTAAENGQIDCLTYLHKNGYDWDMYTTQAAASEGHLNCLKYAHEHGCPSDNDMIYFYPAIHGHIDCLEYLHQQGFLLDTYGCQKAAMYDHLNCVEYLHKNGIQITQEILSYAVNNGSLKCLEYFHLHAPECIIDRTTLQDAVTSDKLDCMKYIHLNLSIGPFDEDGDEKDLTTCTLAAKSGSLACLKYAHENGFEWNYNTCEAAVLYGHLDCFIYAYKNGCPWNNETYTNSGKIYHSNCVAYAFLNPCN